MAKSIIKEISIMLLLLLTIVLVLAVLFYDYVPTTKVIPTVEAYQTSENVSNELSEKVLADKEVVLTHTVTAADLNIYESANNYNKGKANPFASITTDANNATADNNTTTNNTSSNTFYPDENETGTKQ